MHTAQCHAAHVFALNFPWPCLPIELKWNVNVDASHRELKISFIVQPHTKIKERSKCNIVNLIGARAQRNAAMIAEILIKCHNNI